MGRTPEVTPYRLNFEPSYWTIVDSHNWQEEEEMNRDARLMSGILLVTVPTIQYGGYFLLRFV